MPTSFSLAVDTVAVPPREPLRRARTSQCDEGLDTKSSSAHTVEDSASWEAPYSGLCGPDGEPFEYPPVCVRNTFVAFAPGRDASLDEFFKERECQSCPASWGPSFGTRNCAPEEDVALASSRTTACGSNSDASGASATPPPELSDVEDMAELSPGELAASTARIGAMPRSRGFRNTMTDYRHGISSEHDAPQGPTQVAFQPQAFYPDDASQRLPLRPGPIQNSMQSPTSNGEVATYYTGYTESYQGNFVSYGGMPQPGFQAAYEVGYTGPCVNVGGDVCTGNFEGCQASMASYEFGPDGFNNQSQSHVVLQLSSALHQQALLPPPPGAPAPMASQPPPPPAPPTEPPTSGMMGEAMGEVAPTKGSLAHGSGRCKPCAFVYTKGCENGWECPFCHLCDQGEKKKRRKDKLEARRTMRDLRQVLPFGNRQSAGRNKPS